MSRMSIKNFRKRPMMQFVLNHNKHRSHFTKQRHHALMLQHASRIAQMQDRSCCNSSACFAPH